MGRGGYNGGGLIVHAGSGFFSHRGGPGRKRKPKDGEDKPGPAPEGSICDFSPIAMKPKRSSRVVIITKAQKLPRPPKPPPSPITSVVRLKNQVQAALGEARKRVAELTVQLDAEKFRAEKLDLAFRHASSLIARDAETGVDAREIAVETMEIKTLLVNQLPPKTKSKKSKPARAKIKKKAEKKRIAV